mgnify:FL=1|tara:strand:+ start:662 stop:1438 length:777 start_codon:yes stop_codon:yes gene_type:complete
MDINAIKKRLTQLTSQTNKTSNLWKPQPGKNQIRIVPYAHNKDNPFIELFFHYDIGQRSYLSPMSFGRPDPIEEFADKLKAGGNKDDWKLGKKLEAKMRTFVPVIVRGQEKEGVKFWGFGKTVYQELLTFIADPDYGDIADPSTGRDIVVTFKTAEETGKAFPSTSIMVKPNQTAITDDKDVIESVKNQVNITELYKELSYDDLTGVLEDWLNPSDSDEEEAKEEEAEIAKTEVAKTVDTKTETATNAADAFDDLFNN